MNYRPALRWLRTVAGSVVTRLPIGGGTDVRWPLTNERVRVERVLETRVPPALRRARDPLVGVVGWPQETNEEIVSAWRGLGVAAERLTPDEALVRLGPDDVAVGRLDVLPSLDGIEPGLGALRQLERRGVPVLNRAAGLLNAHDKLRTARLLVKAGLPHPRTVHLPDRGEPLAIAPPLVVKPRFGSWGVDVYRCESDADVERVLAEVASRPWFRTHGALLQKLVPPVGFDLRLIVAGGEVVGAAERIAKPGAWRTNVSLGATKRPVDPALEACELATRAAAAIGADLVGVDLLPVDGDHVVLELNGAVEFDDVYDLRASGRSAYAGAAEGLGLLGTAVGGS